MEKICNNLKETHQFAQEFLSNHLNNKNVIALTGDLGSGKTTFTQGIGKSLGVNDPITSPTFLILKSYPVTKHPAFKQLFHLDLYRIQSWEDLLELQIEDIWNDKSNLIVIEWPERISDKLPKDHKKLKFEHIDENTRKITFA